MYPLTCTTKKIGHFVKWLPFWLWEEFPMSLYPKIFVRHCPSSVPNSMLVSLKAHYFHISAGLWGKQLITPSFVMRFVVKVFLFCYLYFIIRWNNSSVSGLSQHRGNTGTYFTVKPVCRTSLRRLWTMIWYQYFIIIIFR